MCDGFAHASLAPPTRTFCTCRVTKASSQGRFREEYPGTPQFGDNVHIATKLAPYPWRVLPGQLVGAAAASAARLRTPQISLGQLHWSAANYGGWGGNWAVL
jgi:pyridoxine 4-dehydrogenase